MSASYKTKLILAFRSGDRCAFPKCGRNLSIGGNGSSAIVTGVAAHIVGEKKGSARYDESMPIEQRNSHDNLIYLCGDHHTQIDKQEEEFSVDLLRSMKRQHEREVFEAMTEAFANVGFPELEEATRGFMQFEPGDVTWDFSLTALAEKIEKNALGRRSKVIITAGLSLGAEVHSYIECAAQTDMDFPERLKLGFLTKYHSLKSEGYVGDTLFEMMCGFAQQGTKEQASRSAALAMLVYLFETCEVFEK